MKMKYLLAVALAIAAIPLSASAGIKLGEIPSGRGVIVYYQLPDGTYAPGLADANGVASQSATITPLGVQQLAVSSAAVGFTPPTGATWCLFKVETAAIRWRDDGTNPTASVGYPQDLGESRSYPGSLSAIKFIRQSSDATLDIACYK